MIPGPQNSQKDETPIVAQAAPASTETGITQAAFATLRGVSEAMISRWKSKGMLVLDREGRVLAAASNARLRETLDPARGGDRTGRQRVAPAAGAAALHNGAAGGSRASYAPVEAGGEAEDRLSYQREAARDKRASAMQRELELAREAGDLLHAGDVTNRIANHVRQALDVLAARRRRLAPKIALETDPRAVEQMLEESDREFCLALAGLGQPVGADQVEGE